MLMEEGVRKSRRWWPLKNKKTFNDKKRHIQKNVGK
jgi:hypothetical protein